MEMINRLGSSKGQLMSIAVLVFVLLMVAALLVLVVVGINYNGVSQSSVIASSSTNYGSVLSQSADTFAYTSGSAALNTLFVYEYNAMFRKTNLISNFSQYMQYLMVSGTLPNVAPGSAAAKVLSNLMGGSTFVAYNSMISSVTGTGSKSITVTETNPLISQSNPYSISIQYTEYVNMNTSSGTFAFTIPVKVSIPLNNTPDLLYAQQGVYRLINFAGFSNLVAMVGNSYATGGNTLGFVYGTVYNLPYGSTCSSVPSPLNSYPYNSQLIIVDSNAPAISSCSSYGGFITNNVVTSPPPMPYLNFSQSGSTVPNLQTGQQLLLYGPASRSSTSPVL